MLAGFVKGGELDRHIHKTLRPSYAKRYRLAMDAIEKALVPLGVELPQPDRSVIGGYFIWIQLPKPLLASEFAARAKEKQNVIVSPGPSFAVYGDEREEELKHSVRLCFSWVDEPLLEEGVGRLAVEVKEMLERTGSG